MTKLRIAFFIDAIRAGAGTENQLLDLLGRLDPARYETYLYTLREPVPDTVPTRIPSRCDCLHLGRLRSFKALKVFWRLVRALRRERIDIAMLYFVDSQIFVPPAAFLARRTVCVVNRRDMGYWYTPRLLRVLRWVNRLVDYFLVNAAAVKKLVADKEHFPAERIKVIYNALATRAPVEGKPLTRGDLSLPENVPIVVLVANLRPVKRVDRFIEMAAQVAEKRLDVRFVILGAGELRETLARQAVDLGLGDRVLFAGSVPDVAPYLDLFDVGVLTSESEGLSNTLIEYSYHGVPAVAFDTGGNSEVVDEGVSGFLVPEGDLAAMADKVLELLGDAHTRKRMGQAGRARVETLFSPDQRRADFEEFFLSVTSARKRAARFDQE